MSLFPTDYLIPDSLHNIWFEIDEPIFVLIHNKESQLCRDFQRNVLEVVSENPRLKGKKIVQMECGEDQASVPEDYKVFRLPCLILYDGEEKGRINSMVSVRDLKEWMENAQ